MTTLNRLLLATLLVPPALGFGIGAASALPGHIPALQSDGAGITLARQGRGADDGANHDVGDDKGGRRGGRGRGADDGAKHDVGDDKGGERGRRGRGADDGARHDAGDDKGGRRA